MDSKPIWKSKSFWFNVVQGVTLFIALPELADVMPQPALRFVPLGVAAGNILLRYMTTTTVTIK